MKAGLVILDGWGLNPDADVRDAVAAADTPNFDRYRASGADGTLVTHGRHVGLPEGQMGNSEVGHINIGAGRVVTQESARVTDAIRRWAGGESVFDDPGDPPLDENPALESAMAAANEADGRLHFLGLVSDGGVHSYQSHLHALIDVAAERGVDAVTHAFTDGRDTAPMSGVEYIDRLETHVSTAGTGAIATVSGRYYAMDRDKNWERTHRAYDAIVNREAEYTAESAVDAVEAAYDRGTTDEFLDPTCIDGSPPLQDGDAAVCFNFRADRARQLTRMLADIDPEWGFETDPPDVHLVTMTEYDESFDLPVAFPPNQPAATLGEILAEHGLTQLRIAETEKYPHVTYFLNGGREREFEGERREIVPSPDVPTYDLQPEMSAPGVTDRAIDVIREDDPDVLVCNYANPDMVGHTGDFDAAVQAVEAVDEQLGRLVAALRESGGAVLITADHGNADDMGTPDDPHTAHTTNPVPFIFLGLRDGDDEGDAERDGDSEDERDGDSDDERDGDSDGESRSIRTGGTLADIAPTLLEILGIPRPPGMTGRSLVE